MALAGKSHHCKAGALQSMVLIAFSVSRKKDLAGAQYQNFISKEEDFPSAFLYHLREKKGYKVKWGLSQGNILPTLYQQVCMGRDADLSNL